MRIGKRLEKVLEYIECGLDVVLDVGTDHGFLALKLVEEKDAKKVYATDISEGSLNKAYLLAKKYDKQEKIKCVLSDGFKSLPKNLKADLVVIAGMGGNETIKILKNEKNLSRFKSFILQPMQDVEILREYLLTSGFSIDADETVKDRNKFYHIIKCKYTQKKLKYTLEDVVLGKTDLVKKSEDFFEFLKEELNQLQSRKKYLTAKDLQKFKIYSRLIK